MTPKPAWHVSMLNELSLCGESFYRSSILGRRSRVGVEAVTGTAVHAGLKFDLSHKRDTGEAADLDAVRDCAADALEATWLGEEPLLDDEERSRGARAVRDAAKDAAVTLATLGHNELVPTIRAHGLQVEVRRRITLEGFPFDLEGTSDIEEGDERLLDAKTSSKAYPKHAAHGAPQLDMYAFLRAAEGRPPLKFVGYRVFVKTATPKLQVLDAPAPRTFDAIRLRIERATAVVQSGAFMPVDPSGPSGWKCQPAYCGHFDECPFGRARRVQI